LITIENLSKHFRTPEGDLHAVDDISFEVARGQFFSLVGPSGCGKSTTLRMIAGLERPTRGSIEISDRVVYSSSDRTFVPANKRSIGMVFQSYAVWPHMTVFSNVAYPLKVQRVAKATIRKKVHAALELVGLAGLEDRPSSRLSGGQQQRVALARAIVHEPQLLLLDEPLSNLDAQLRKQMRAEIKGLQERIGVTTIFVTHDQEEALSMSDEVAILDAGKIRQVGRPEEIYHAPTTQFTAAFVGNINLVDGRKDSPVTAGVNELMTPMGPLKATLATDDDSFGNGQQFTVGIRPELIEIRASGAPSTENTFDGSVTRLMFLGDSIECHVTVGAQELLVKTSSAATEMLRVGAEVSVTLPARYARILPAEDPAEA